MDSDKRSSNQRRRTLKQGRVFLSGSTSMDCTVRDQSETGARLDFAGPVRLPEEFRLLLIGSNLVMPAELAWQRGLSAGVRFTGAGQPPPRKGRRSPRGLASATRQL